MAVKLRHLLVLAALAAVPASLPGGRASAQGDSGDAARVDLALILLNDVSKSMDNEEFVMVKDGYRAAFSDPEIIAAVSANPGGVAIAYVEFSGRDEFATVRDWAILRDEASTRAFGHEVAAAPRSSRGNTALAANLRAAADMLTRSAFTRARKVIDIASDHHDDYGRSARVRDVAVGSGITINALPIIDEQMLGTFDGQLSYSQAFLRPGTADFYRRDVIGGPGSFVIEVRDYSSFAVALKRKLLRELLVSSNDTTIAPGTARLR